MRWPLGLAVFSLAAIAQPDFLIVNARIVDGTGSPWWYGSVSVAGDSIAAIGPNVNRPAAQVVDAHGLVLAPGFIDTHSHALDGLEKQPAAENILRQGVTTIIEGPDGRSPLPLAPFLTKIAALPPGVNFGLMAGHGTIRSQVMGTENRPAQPEELQRMKELMAQAMRDGAFGLSTGLFYVPGNYAPTEEVIELARIAGQMGGIHTSHIRDEAEHIIDSVNETIRIGSEGHLPTQVTHHKVIGEIHWGRTRETLDLVEQARRRGVDVTLDVYPYPASGTSLTAWLPPWAVAGGRDALKERLSVPATRDRILAEYTEVVKLRGGAEKVQLTNCPAGATLAEAVRKRNLEVNAASAAQTALDIVLAGGCTVISHSLSEEDIERVLRSPYSMVASDGGIAMRHPRSYGTFARVLALYVREKRLLTLEEAIRKMTSFPATRFRIYDRGILRPGMKADLVLFHPARIQDQATYSEPRQLATGVDSVWVNGRPAIREGRLAAERYGRILYGPAHQP